MEKGRRRKRKRAMDVPTRSLCFMNFVTHISVQAFYHKTKIRLALLSSSIHCLAWLHRSLPLTHLLRGQSSAGKVGDTTVEASLDQSRVKFHEVLHLLLLDDLSDTIGSDMNEGNGC
jgi:hypothetical protein